MATKLYKDFKGPGWLRDAATIQDYLVPTGTTGAVGKKDAAHNLTEIWFTSDALPELQTAMYTQWDLAVPIKRT